MIVSDPAEIVKLSPIATVRGVVSAPDPRNVPDETASQNEMWLYVSAVPTFVQFTSADVVIDPPEAAENVAATDRKSVV